MKMKNAGSKSKVKTSEWKKNKSLYLLLAPFFILFTIFTVLPVGFAMVMSFTDYNVIQTPNFVGLDNYISLFLNDPLFLTAIKNSFILAVIIGPCGYILSFLMAWMLCELNDTLRVILTV